MNSGCLKVYIGVLLIVSIVYSVKGIPTLVELKKLQYDQLSDLISNIAIDIEGENITLNADFNTLNSLQNYTNFRIGQVYERMTILHDYRTEQLRQNFDRIDGGVVGINHTNIDGFLMLNQTLTDLYKLEKEEVQAITDEFFRKLDKVNEVLNTINGFVDTIQTVVGVINTFISGAQNTNLVAQVTEQKMTNTLLQEFIDGFPVKVVEVVDETVFTINGAELSVDDTAFSFCEIADPTFGEGPINCQNSGAFGFNIPEASLTSITKKKV